MFIHYLRDHLWRITSIVIFITMCISTSAHAQGEGQTVNSLGWNSDGTKLAIGYTNGTLQIVDAFSYQILDSYQLAQEGFQAIYEVAWNPIKDSLLAVVGGDSGNRQAMVLVLDISSGSQTFTFSDVQDIASISWNPDGARLAISVDFIADNLGNRNVQIWDVASNQRMLRISVGSHGITSFAWSPDGSRLAGASTDSNVVIWDASGGETMLTLVGHTAVATDVVWNPDGTLLATSSEVADSTIRIWDAETGTNVLAVPNVYTSEVIWSPDGGQLAAPNIARAIDVFDPSTGQRIDEYAEGAFASSIAYSPYGGRLTLPQFGGQ